MKESLRPVEEVLLDTLSDLAMEGKISGPEILKEIGPFDRDFRLFADFKPFLRGLWYRALFDRSISTFGVVILFLTLGSLLLGTFTLGLLWWRSDFEIWKVLQQGHYTMYFLLFICVSCLVIIVERAWAIWGAQPKTGKLADQIISNLREGNFNEAIQATADGRTLDARIFHNLILAAQTTADRELLLELDYETRSREKIELKRYVWILAAASSSAPFIGLFGTVVGILVAFQSMAVIGTGNFSVVAAGISEALISTAVGLAIAIVAVIFFNYFSTRIDEIMFSQHDDDVRVIDAAIQGRQNRGSLSTVSA